MKKVDYIIVGQGIAGTILAHCAKQSGKTILVIDESRAHSPSKISAGIINPITGRKYVKSWMIDELLPEAEAVYQSLSELLGFTVFQQQHIIRAFSGNEEESNWLVRSSVPDFQRYVQDEVDLGIYKDIAIPAYGYGEIKGGGRVQVKELIAAYRAELAKKEELLAEKFDFSVANITAEKIDYKGITAEKIIFCEGMGIKENPFFEYLPVWGNKGEVLIIKIPNFSPKKLLKKGVFLVPIAEEKYWVGSTYYREFEDAVPSEHGLATLVKKLDKILDVPYEIVEHLAAIRPTILDRQPLLGTHHTFKNLVIFNGMGTKGASLAPYWAKHLIAALENNTPIDKQANIARHERFLTEILR